MSLSKGIIFSSGKNDDIFLSLKKYLPPVAHLCSGWAIDGPMWQIYKQAIYKVTKWRKD